MKCGGVKAVPMDVCQGENFSQEPKKQENKKHQKNEQLILLDWHSCKNFDKPPPPPQKKTTTSFDPWRGSEEKLDRWHGVKLYVFVFVFWFSHGFWGIFGPRWQKPRENQKNTQNKINRPIERVWGEAGQVTWGEAFVLIVFPWFWTSFFLFQNLDCLYESLW